MLINSIFHNIGRALREIFKIYTQLYNYERVCCFYPSLLHISHAHGGMPQLRGAMVLQLKFYRAGEELGTCMYGRGSALLTVMSSMLKWVSVYV